MNFLDLYYQMMQSPGGGDAGVGTPGFAAPGAVTGIGSLSGSQALGSFFSGLGPGVVGQGLASLGLPGSLAGPAGKAGITGLGIVGGFPTFGLSLANSLFGGLVSLADAAQASVGPRGNTPVSLSDSVRGIVDEPDPNPNIPDVPDPVTFGLPNTPDDSDAGVSGGAVSGTGDDGGVGAGGVGIGGDGTGVAAWNKGGKVGPPWQYRTPAKNKHSNAKHYSTGGQVKGPKGTDKVPGWLTSGEFVVDQDSTHKFEPILRLINSYGRN